MKTIFRNKLLSCGKAFYITKKELKTTHFYSQMPPAVGAKEYLKTYHWL